MISVATSSSSSSLTPSMKSARSHQSMNFSQRSPAPSAGSISGSSSASSSRVSLSQGDDENVTITVNSHKRNGKSQEKSVEDLRLLAASTHMTELSFSITDVLPRIFEIQELRHKSYSSEDFPGTTSVIDQALMNLDERLEFIAKGIKTVNDTLEPLLQQSKMPTTATQDENAPHADILRKHTSLMAEWENLQRETEQLREELKEDKWLTVFRTVTEQADGMMSSLEKAVNRCQDFVWQIYRRGPDDTIVLSGSTSSERSQKSLSHIEMFNSLLDSYEAKKKHYVPATSKVLSIIDKGVKDRVTKNGETLRRHTESNNRWKALTERITRTDVEMENVRKILMTTGDATPSESGSNVSGATAASKANKNGYLVTPPSGKKTKGASASTLSRSISPFRRLAKRLKGAAKSPARNTPEPPLPSPFIAPSSEPTHTLRRQRTSIFTFRGQEPLTPVTPGHKYSQSLTPDVSPSAKKLDVGNTTVKGKSPTKQRWNGSTKIEPGERTLTLKSRKTSSITLNKVEYVPPVPRLSDQYRRSASRSSMASSRPWSPVTSSVSTAPSSNPSAPPPMHRPPSRPPSRAARPPSRAQTPGLSPAPTPRPRPRTPSHIPAPAKQSNWGSSQSGVSDAGWDDEASTLMQRAFSPTLSVSARSGISTNGLPPRPPSRSMIPVPSVHLHSASRPSSTLSHYASEIGEPSMFRMSAMRSQTPEFALRATAQQIPFYQGPGAGGKARVSVTMAKLPPSSFRDSGRTPGSRPSSRAGACTPTGDLGAMQHVYVPANSKDPLDAEVASVVNSIAHGLLVERVDPPLKKIPKENEEIRAQYAFSNSLSRKVVTCRLTTMTRRGGTASADQITKKVMCRVGGGWQDLQLYMLNRQAGM